MNCSKFHEIKKCRVCGNEHLDVVLDLGDQYLSGIFPKEIDKDMSSMDENLRFYLDLELEQEEI